MSNDIDLSKGHNSEDVDVTTVYEAGGVSISESDRLKFARQLLFFICLICVGVFVAHGYDPKNEGVNQIFELIKIGALPLITLIVSFYFPNNSAK